MKCPDWSPGCAKTWLAVHLWITMKHTAKGSRNTRRTTFDLTSSANNSSGMFLCGWTSRPPRCLPETDRLPACLFPFGCFTPNLNPLVTTGPQYRRVEGRRGTRAADKLLMGRQAGKSPCLEWTRGFRLHSTVDCVGYWWHSDGFYFSKCIATSVRWLCSLNEWILMTSEISCTVYNLSMIHWFTTPWLWWSPNRLEVKDLTRHLPNVLTLELHAIFDHFHYLIAKSVSNGPLLL